MLVKPGHDEKDHIVEQESDGHNRVQEDNIKA